MYGGWLRANCLMDGNRSSRSDGRGREITIMYLRNSHATPCTLLCVRISSFPMCFGEKKRKFWEGGSQSTCEIEGDPSHPALDAKLRIYNI